MFYLLHANFLVSPSLSVGGESYVLIYGLSLPSPPQESSEGIAVVLCVSVCVCPAFLFRMLLLSLRILERLQTFSTVAKSCLLSIDVFFLPLQSGKYLWCAEKYVSKCYVQIVQALGYLKASNDRASQDL